MLVPSSAIVQAHFGLFPKTCGVSGCPRPLHSRRATIHSVQRARRTRSWRVANRSPLRLGLAASKSFLLRPKRTVHLLGISRLPCPRCRTFLWSHAKIRTTSCGTTRGEERHQVDSTTDAKEDNGESLRDAAEQVLVCFQHQHRFGAVKAPGLHAAAGDRESGHRSTAERTAEVSTPIVSLLFRPRRPSFVVFCRWR
eukprot:scaffold489_cov259-Pinguiococcus_pyrenoidosus.AAC.42